MAHLKHLDGKCRDNSVHKSYMAIAVPSLFLSFAETDTFVMTVCVYTEYISYITYFENIIIFDREIEIEPVHLIYDTFNMRRITICKCHIKKIIPNSVHPLIKDSLLRYRL